MKRKKVFKLKNFLKIYLHLIYINNYISVINNNNNDSNNHIFQEKIFKNKEACIKFKKEESHMLDIERTTMEKKQNQNPL